MDGVSYCQVVTTTGSREAADRLARGAVEARLAACGQVLGPISSSYWWEGAVTSDQEWQVVLKTTTAAYPALERHLREAHSYDVPEILCLPVLGGSPAYLDWLGTEVRPPPTGRPREHPARGAGGGRAPQAPPVLPGR